MIQEGEILSGRVDALKLAGGAEFKQVRCIVHLSPHGAATDYGQSMSLGQDHSSPLLATSLPTGHAPPDLQVTQIQLL